jgi:hypothetical protein
MKIMRGAHRGVVIALVALTVTLGLAACGSSSNSTGSAGASTKAAAGNFSGRRTALVACLKKHGVTLPSGFGARRPGGAGPGGGTGTTGTGTTRRPGTGFFGGGGGAGAGRFGNPKTLAALKACGGGFGGRFGGRAGGFRARFSGKVLTSFVACVKKHGFTLPKPNTSGTGPVFPASIEKNPKFVAASKSCTSILRSSFGGAGGPGGAGGGAPGGAPPTS